MRLFWGANQKLFVYLDPTIQMVSIAPVTQFVKSNANLTSFFVRMGLIPRGAKMQTCVYLEEGTMTEICVPAIVHQLVPITNIVVQEDFKVLDAE